MKKTVGTILIIILSFWIIGIATRGGSVQPASRDRTGAVTGIIFVALLMVGLFFSVRWRMKLSGHHYKLGRQTTAAILFWYSSLAAMIGIAMAAANSGDRLRFILGISMVVISSLSAYACHKWRNRLLAEEKLRIAIPPNSA